MANVSRTVDIIFNADDRVTRAVKNISASLDQMDRIAMKIVDPFATIGKGIIAADVALAGLAAGGMAISIKKAGEFNDSFREISTLIDATGADLEKYRKDILEYGATSSKSLLDVTGSLYQALSAGREYTTSLEFITQAEKLAIAGRGDLESTTKALASVMNAYGATVDETEDYADVFFQTVKYGITTLPELAEQFGKLTTIAAEAGIPFDDLATAAATLTAAGLPTERAMTSLRTAIDNIIKPSAEAKQAAADLKIEFDSAAVKSRGFAAIMQDVFAATTGNVGAVAELFGNIRGLGAALVVGGDNAGRFAKISVGMANRMGTVSIAHEKMVNSFELANQRFVNNMDLFFIMIGSLLEQAYGKTINSITNIFQALVIAINEGTFNNIFTAFDNFIGELTKFITDVAVALPEALAKVDFSEFLDALGGIGTELSKLFAGLDLTDPDDLAIAIQNVVNSITSLLEITGGMIPVFVDLFKLIKSGIEDFSNMDDESKKAFGGLLAGAIILKELGIKLGLLILTLSESGAEFKGVFQKIADSIKVMFESTQIVMDGVAVAIATVISGILGLVDNLTLGMIQSISLQKQAYDEFAAGAVTDIKDRTKNIKDIFDDAGEHAKKTTDVFSTSLTDLYKQRKDIIFKATKETTDAAKKTGEEIDKAIPDEKIIKTGAVWDALQAGIVQEQMEKTIPVKKEMQVVPVLDDTNIIDIKAKLEAEAKIMEKTLELQAQIDIAQIEADTERIKSAFESINVSIQSTGDVLASLFGNLAGTEMDLVSRFAIEEQIRAENERREASLDLQRRLTEAQIAALKARIAAMHRGDPLITVSAEGLEPHLQAIFFYILEQVQIRVNEDQQEFLLGINP